MTQKSSTHWNFTAQALCTTAVDSRTVMEARGQVEKALRAGAQIADPVTGRVAQVYDRGITRKMAEVLAVLYHLTKDNSDYVGAAALKTKGGDYGKLRHWGLIECQAIETRTTITLRPCWRITVKGVRFVEDGTSIPKKILVFNDRRVGFVDLKTTTFAELLGGVDLQTLLAKWRQK